MKKILIPTDGSVLADYAYDLAHDIANRTAAYIDILSVIPVPANTFVDTGGNLPHMIGEDYGRLFQQKEAASDRLSAWAASKTDIQNIEITIGRLEDEIVKYVDDNQVDLIVMGTAGASGLQELLIGSNAERIVRNSPVPVLTLKSDRSRLMVKDMLLIGDFDYPAKQNLDIIKELQRAYKGTIHLLRVNTQEDLVPSRTIKEKMQSYIDLNELEGVEMHIYCDQTIEKGILHFTEDHKIDLMMIGTYQRGELSRLLNASLSEKIVNHIEQPILTFQV